ncbi:MAG: glycoside hydrolase family 57 protein [bacterium]
MYDDKPLYISFVWHMHQPYYKNLVTGETTLPWVRLHCAKDYYDMVAVLDDFPEIHQTFNLVPSLITQIEDYTLRNGSDKFLDLTLKEAKKLTAEERVFILHNFFMANWDTMVKIYPRYEELLSKRGHFVSVAELTRIQKNFTAQELIDLAVLFNLSWIDPYFRDKDDDLKKISAKGEKFTEEDKHIVINKHKQIMATVLGKYKEMQDKGQIEITTAPFYHPILPLLCNTSIAKVSNPNTSLPQAPFAHPEDAQVQVEKAVAFYTQYFGRPPSGMWPSEGSVSEDIVPIVAKAGIKWMASDEAILANSLGGMSINRGNSGSSLYSDILYKPYKVRIKGSEVDIIFRDRELSDLIGFSYSRMEAGKAVEHFIHKLHSIREGVKHTSGDHLVSIILDGENAWEFYPNDGRDFLYALYRALANDPLLKTTTVSDYLKEHPSTNNVLPNLYPGSWINHNYDIWIGHPEDALSWDYLSKTRDVLVNFELSFATNENREKINRAWEEIYIAEGSDWNWWYGDDHTSGNDEEFDNLYRHHLMNVYKIIGAKVPEQLFTPIKGAVKVKPVLVPIGLINPKLDGKISDYFEWEQAGFYDVRKSGGTMHQSESIVNGIYYGFNLENLFLRIDTEPLFGVKEIKNLVFDFRFLEPATVRAELVILPEKDKIRINLFRTEKDTEIKIKELDTIAVDKIIELAIPFSDLGLKSDDKVKLALIVKKDNIEIERWPYRSIISFTVPGENYILDYWSV